MLLQHFQDKHSILTNIKINVIMHLSKVRNRSCYAGKQAVSDFVSLRPQVALQNKNLFDGCYVVVFGQIVSNLFLIAIWIVEKHWASNYRCCYIELRFHYTIWQNDILNHSPLFRTGVLSRRILWCYVANTLPVCFRMTTIEFFQI